jgi:uncharacterized protein (TIGR02145 family)
MLRHSFMRTLFKNASFLFILISWIMINVISCDKGNLPPTAKLAIFPSVGDTSILFDFSAKGSSDDKEYEIGLVYRWDFEGDGIWDTEYSQTNGITHKYRESGRFCITVEVKDLDRLTAIATDTVEIYHMNTDIDTLVDPRDGGIYRIVKIAGRWWMAENLRYGIEILSEQEQTDNDAVEFYINRVGITGDSVGGIYRWLEAMNYQTDNPQGICPDGWHIPTSAEWEALFTPYSHFYAAQYYRKNGHSNLNLDLHSSATRSSDEFLWQVSAHSIFDWGFWASTSRYSQDFWRIFPGMCFFSSTSITFDVSFGDLDNDNLKAYFSVRCLKNKTG